MDIARQLRAIRTYRRLSRKQLADRTGLQSPYISRLENGHTIPSLETLTRFATALEVKLYQLLYDGEDLPGLPLAPGADKSGCSRREISYIRKMRRALLKTSSADKELILYAASKIANRRKRSPVKQPH
jgi:transcriptional regulator with XRE-family HTH domain